MTDKNAVMDNERVADVIAEVEKEMAGNGRVLVRPSGTEPLVRVMVEAPTKRIVYVMLNGLLMLFKKRWEQNKIMSL